MLQISYEIWGVVVLVVLIGIWAIKYAFKREKTINAEGLPVSADNSLASGHGMEHRVLMYLMAQQTESVLAALARTIDEERQKLGVIVRKPSLTQTIGADHTANINELQRNAQPPYEQILPMARKGLALPIIARQLQLPESEISLYLRLHPA